MIQKSFHRIFTTLRAFTRRPRRPRRQLPRFSSRKVLHAFARGDVPGCTTAFVRSFARSLARRVPPRARIHTSHARAFASPLDGRFVLERARVCHPPRPGTRASLPSSPGRSPPPAALFVEISRRFFTLCRAVSHFFALFRTSSLAMGEISRDLFPGFLPDWLSHCLRVRDGAHAGAGATSAGDRPGDPAVGVWAVWAPAGG